MALSVIDEREVANWTETKLNDSVPDFKGKIRCAEMDVTKERNGIGNVRRKYRAQKRRTER